MLRSLILTKGIHILGSNWSSTKTQLLKLRKKTGYPFESCKKALLLNDHNLEKSEIWLKEEAQRLGFAKANKLMNRPTVQGVIALAFDKLKEIATIVEVNCETDFVARNKCFHSIVDVITSSCLDHAKTHNAFENSFSKVNLESAELMKLSSTDGKSLADHIAITIGNLGENITLRRAMCLNTRNTGLNVMGLTHPSNTTGSNSHSGKYGSLLIYRKQPDIEKINQKSMESSHNEILRQMCQHVIGMNPKSVGLAKVQEPIKSQTDKTFDEINELSMDEKTNEIEQQEMLEQTFLLDPTMTFAEVATYYGIDVLDFVRYECGET